MEPLHDTPIARPRFIVGIDLGTTNCALAFVDTEQHGTRIEDFPVRQFVAADTQEERDALPSFLYALRPEECTDEDRAVHATYRVGIHARDQGAPTPGRLIASTKSWLCHGGVDRTASILPWHADEEVPPLSPVQAQSIILRHLRHAWDRAHPAHPLHEQELYITVPASFDEVARELTVEAARTAGLPALVLLEEPQAAFYAWLSRHENDWTRRIAPDDHILICDVGGGTTDMTLIHARPDANGQVAFHRTAVGEHLILGGDNLDLALARAIETRFTGSRLPAADWSALVRLCRHHKETLLGGTAPEEVSVLLPGRGARLLAGARQAAVTKKETHALLLDGFMPVVERTATPARRASGFQEFGLPFAADPGITRYLAEFLRTHLPNRDGLARPPDAILLNGGLFEATAMRERLKQVFAHWFAESPDAVTSIDWLDHQRLDLAVARGAAYFGLVRRGKGVRVISKLARSYYIGVESSRAAGATTPDVLCLAPAGLAAEESVRIDQLPLRARLKTPVAFQLYVSSQRTTDRAGDRIPYEEDAFTALPPVRTILTAGRQSVRDEIDVYLTAAQTEWGALDLRIVEAGATSRSWKLAFDLRAATHTELHYHQGTGERAGVVETGCLDEARGRLRDYLRRSVADLGSTSVLKELEGLLGASRQCWPATVLRALWAELMEHAERRAVSAVHEQRWLNLVGYSLRPGFGIALDDWRVGETWKQLRQGMRHANHPTVRAEWWILWRRLAGGLTAGQQTALSDPALAALNAVCHGKSKVRLQGGELRLDEHETVELLRCLGSLEQLARPARTAFGDLLIRHFLAHRKGSHQRAALWALGRTGARIPVYGPLHNLPTPEKVTTWLDAVTRLDAPPREAAFTILLLARLTGDRYRDVDDTTRHHALRCLAEEKAPPHWQQLIREGGPLDHEEATAALGDQLPIGLILS